MGRIAVIGEHSVIGGYALAGVLVLPAATPDAVLRQWHTLPPDVEVVIVTEAAAEILLCDQDPTRPPYTVVIP